MGDATSFGGDRNRCGGLSVRQSTDGNITEKKKETCFYIKKYCTSSCPVYL
jgi:hypothetical protein